MKKYPKSQKRSRPAFLCILSIVLLIAGIFSSLFCLISLLSFRGDEEWTSLLYSTTVFFSISAVPSLAMGILGLLSIRRDSAKLTLAGLLIGIVTLVALLILLCVSAATVASAGFETVYLLIVFYSPASVVTILYIKALQKRYSSHFAKRRSFS